MAVTRLTRAQRKEQTRQALLDAGRDLFVREGFHGTTLDRVAAEAGFTKGAVYASFPTKADLFLAIFERRTDERIAQIEVVAEQAGSVIELTRLMARDWERVMGDEHAWSLLLIEFWVHAARDEGLRERLAAQRRRIRAVMVGAAERADAGGELGMAAEDYVAAMLALGNGFNLEGFLDPADVPRRLRAGGEALWRGARR
jgi:AcrR family transcriptional regulator